VLIREDLASELLVATRVLAHAGVLNAEFRLSARAGEVIYVNRRGASNATMSPEDIAAVWLTDGYALRGEPPESIERHLEAYRGDPALGSVLSDGDSVWTGKSRVEAALRCVRPQRPELEGLPDDQAWSTIENEAKASGAFIGMA